MNTIFELFCVIGILSNKIGIVGCLSCKKNMLITKGSQEYLRRKQNKMIGIRSRLLITDFEYKTSIICHDSGEKWFLSAAKLCLLKPQSPWERIWTLSETLFCSYVVFHSAPQNEYDQCDTILQIKILLWNWAVNDPFYTRAGNFSK